VSLLVAAPSFNHPFPPLRPSAIVPSRANPFTPSAYQREVAQAQQRARYRATLPQMQQSTAQEVALYRPNGQVQRSLPVGMVVSEQA
jgi:hypothetical protein